MVKKIGDILGNRLLYICVLMVTLLFDTILLVHNYTGPLIKLFLLWGALVIAWDFFNGRKMWRTRPMIALMIFSALYMVTAVTAERVYLVSNIKTLAYMVLFFVILYGHDRNISPENWKKEIRTIMTTFVITTAVLSAICMLTYVFQVNIELLTVDGYMHFGMADNRLWGLYNPNIGGCINYMSIVFSLGLLLTLENKKTYKSILLGFNMILQYVCLLLTSSRTSVYTLLLCLGGIAFFVLSSKYEKFSIKSIKGFALNVIVCALIMGGIYGIGDPVKNVLAYVPMYVESDISEKIMNYLATSGADSVGENTTNTESKEKVELTRLEVLENRDGGMLTGRLFLWKAGIKAWEKSPVFGISKNAIFDYAEEFVSEKQWRIALEVSLHNGYLTLLVASGIVGAVVFMIFLIWNIIPMIRSAFIQTKSKDYLLYIICLAITFSFLLVEFFEARILYRTEIFTAMFWIVCGFTYNYVEIVNNKKKALENKEDIHE